MCSMSRTTVEKKTAVRNGIGRMAFSVIVFLLEALFLVSLFTTLSTITVWIDAGMRVFALILVLAIYSMNRTSSMKMPWIILILLMPIVGVGIYLVVGLNSKTVKMRRRYEAIDRVLLPELTKQDAGKKARAAGERLKRYEPQLATISYYLTKNSGYPLYADSDIVYYDDAAKAFEAQKEAMRQAKRFIFLEYHAIEDKESWHSVLEILKERADAGVEVRVFYDDMGSIGFINRDFIKRMENVGIRCRVFNPFMPGLNLFLNNRDHRKITVIDGFIGFTGGYNIANEYFNITQPYGRWKDTGVRLTGRAVRSMTATFLENWNAVKGDDRDDTGFDRYLLTQEADAFAPRTNGTVFVQPYADSPLDHLHIGEDVYISMAEKAVRYCWFITPYLILTDETIHAFTLAAMRGVDVRVITPGIPDKKIIYGVTRSFYNSLTRGGVRIFEWSPGFCHCKMSVMDDKAATCGTINLDYRSLYHHFENGCLYMNCDAVLDTKKDFDRILTQCREVTEEYTTGRSARRRLWHLFLRLFAQLL